VSNGGGPWEDPCGNPRPCSLQEADLLPRQVQSASLHADASHSKVEVWVEPSLDSILHPGLTLS